MSDWPKPSSRYAEYVRKLAACGHWKFTGIVGGDKAVLSHRGATVTYGMHDGGNDYNGPRNFAAAAQRACGCTFVQPRGRKRSRKAVTASGINPSSSYSNPTQQTVDNLNAEWRRLTDSLAAFEALGGAASRCQVNEALQVIRRRADVEERLTELHQPIPN